MLTIENLKIAFSSNSGAMIPALRGISLKIAKGENLALVGASGSGKSVTALAIARLLPCPETIYQGGSITWDGKNLLTMSDAELQKIRGGKIAYIFQDPSTSLNPIFTIRSQIAEMITLHRPDVTDIDQEIIQCLHAVGINNPKLRLHDYPHHLSGGMQQRVMIAMALVARPDLLIADEPTTALDVTIQAKILHQLKQLQQKFGMGILLITHNLSIVAGFAHHVAVLYRGEIVEYGPMLQVLHTPQHPYTRALISCIPKLNDCKRRLSTIEDSKEIFV